MILDNFSKDLSLDKDPIQQISTLDINSKSKLDAEIMKIAKGVNNKIITVLGGNHLSNAVKDYEHNLLAKHPKLSDQIADLEDTNIDFGILKDFLIASDNK